MYILNFKTFSAGGCLENALKVPALNVSTVISCKGHDKKLFAIFSECIEGEPYIHRKQYQGIYT